jgi:hypothetical protein
MTLREIAASLYFAERRKKRGGHTCWKARFYFEGVERARRALRYWAFAPQKAGPVRQLWNFGCPQTRKILRSTT